MLWKFVGFLVYLVFSGVNYQMGASLAEFEADTHQVLFALSFVDPHQVPPMTEHLQSKFDRVMKFFGLQPYLDPCALPSQVAQDHQLPAAHMLDDFGNRKDILKSLKSQHPLLVTISTS